MKKLLICLLSLLLLQSSLYAAEQAKAADKDVQKKENKKNGKTVSFKFRAYLGRNEIGKQINQYTTWFAPEGLTPTKALKAAEKAAAVRRHAVHTDRRPVPDLPEQPGHCPQFGKYCG